MSKIFRIYCSTGDFLFDFLKVIITAIVCLATFRDCYASLDMAFNVILGKGLPAVYHSRRK